MLLAKLLPACDEPVGALERVDADFRFDLHRADSLMAAPLCCLADQFRLIAECAVEVGGALGPDRVQSIAGAVQRLALVGHRVDTQRAGLPDSEIGRAAGRGGGGWDVSSLGVAGSFKKKNN